MPPERLQKVMANSGIASRRACEELITEGRVTVNGEVVRELGTKVDLARDVVEVDGRRVKSKQEKRYTYLMLNKPPGILSVFNDERGRPGLETLITSNNRLYPVGRLDADSEGLLLLTDDGEMTLRLSHPRYEHVKTYYVLLNRAPGTDTLARVRRGIDLGDGTTAPSDWKVIDKPPSVHPLPDTEQPDGAWIRVIMREGKKRQIRRMAAAEHLNVRRLIRVQIGPLMLDRKLKPGQSRPLNRSEIQRLRMATRPRTTRPGTRGRTQEDPRARKGAAPSKDRSSVKRGPTRGPAPNTKGGPPRSRTANTGGTTSSKSPARQKQKGPRD
ncbi:MAG TPA: pseudouridine synthase [Anaerolineae bacterium]|nr:rRNA pseudouridine synthase [Anaerolineae bacterium]HRX03633.1 pseudouridine synthase [Anaerolineae bacterium]